MKYRGKKIQGIPEEIVPIIREPENIIITVRGIASYDTFLAICPAPEPPTLKLPGGKTKQNYEDKNFLAEFGRWMDKKVAWASIQSLSSPDIEWESVDLNNPDTYKNWYSELQSAGFTDAELNRIALAMNRVNGLNEQLIDEARQSFLTDRAALQSKSSSQTAEVNNT